MFRAQQENEVRLRRFEATVNARDTTIRNLKEELSLYDRALDSAAWGDCKGRLLTALAVPYPICPEMVCMRETPLGRSMTWHATDCTWLSPSVSRNLRGNMCRMVAGRVVACAHFLF